jgi:hypothetical protein
MSSIIVPVDDYSVRLPVPTEARYQAALWRIRRGDGRKWADWRLDAIGRGVYAAHCAAFLREPSASIFAAADERRRLTNEAEDVLAVLGSP